MQLARQSKFLLYNLREENRILAFSFLMVICDLTGLWAARRSKRSRRSGRRKWDSDVAEPAGWLLAGRRNYRKDAHFLSAVRNVGPLWPPSVGVGQSHNSLKLRRPVGKRCGVHNGGERFASDRNVTKLSVVWGGTVPSSCGCPTGNTDFFTDISDCFSLSELVLSHLRLILSSPFSL